MTKPKGAQKPTEAPSTWYISTPQRLRLNGNVDADVDGVFCKSRQAECLAQALVAVQEEQLNMFWRVLLDGPVVPRNFGMCDLKSQKHEAQPCDDIIPEDSVQTQ